MQAISFQLAQEELGTYKKATQQSVHLNLIHISGVVLREVSTCVGKYTTCALEGKLDIGPYNLALGGKF